MVWARRHLVHSLLPSSVDEYSDPGLKAANAALAGRRIIKTASRFASIELRELSSPQTPSRSQIAWEVGAVCSVCFAALIAVVGLWCW